MSTKKIGLSLSGGGYRVAAFHLGTFRKLYELNVLDKVDFISTISGGSITGAYYCLYQQDFTTFETFMKKALTTKSVIQYILKSFTFLKAISFVLFFLGLSIYVLFTAYAWLCIPLIALLIALLLCFQFKIFPVSKVIEDAYNKFFYKNATLSELRDHPALVIGATNIQTSRPFTFSKGKMEDTTYTYGTPPINFKQEKFPIARAVMASSCVPFAFTPIMINKEFFFNQSDATKINPQLVDGGIYDNQGIHKLTQGKSIYYSDIVITSDAGNKLPFTKSFNNVVVLLIRTMDVFMARIQNFQKMQNLYQNTTVAKREIAYLSLGWDIESCIPGFIKNLADGNITPSVISAHQLPDIWVTNVGLYVKEIQQWMEQRVNYSKIFSEKLSADELMIARSVGTNLTCLTAIQVDCLSSHAANITELQIKLYCPSL